MILFLNFAPLSYGGGAERWMSSVAEALQKSEEVMVLQVDRSISDFYAELVLGRKFDVRFPVPLKKSSQLFINLDSLVPFSPAFNHIHEHIAAARVIYTKYEVNELLLIFYFGGVAGIRKTIIGLHSPFLYSQKSLSLFEKLHNLIYASYSSRFVLSHVQKVHALNQDQLRTLQRSLGVTNAVLIPNFIETAGEVTKIVGKNLRVGFVGELSKRKGADILLDVIKQNPEHIQFEIAGDGPMKHDFIALNNKNATYQGYRSNEDVLNILKRSDVLFMPSKAESFSLACLEALGQGLTVVCSGDIATNSLEKYLEINTKGTVSGYVQIFSKLLKRKASGQLANDRVKTAKEIRAKFSKQMVLKQLKKAIFNVGGLS